MRVVFPSAAGGAGAAFVPYYDRVALPIHLAFAMSDGFDAVGTTRWTYTVPVDRRALVGSLGCYVEYNNIATEMLPSQCQIHNNIVPVSTTRILTSQVTQGTQGDKDRVVVNPELWMDAADVLICRTFEARITGNSSYAGILNALEFDV